MPKQNDKINVNKYKKNIIKCYLVGKNVNYFKKQIKGKLIFSITKNLKKFNFQISKDCRPYRKKKFVYFIKSCGKPPMINLIILKIEERIQKIM